MALLVKRNGLLAGKERKAGETLSDAEVATISEPSLAALIGSGHLEPMLSKADQSLQQRLDALEARMDALEGGEQPRVKRPYNRSNAA